MGETKEEKRIKQGCRSSRLALMVNDMLVLWLGLAQAPELLKYLQVSQNERLIHFLNQLEQRRRERAVPLFYLFTALRYSTYSSNGQHHMNNVHV